MSNHRFGYFLREGLRNMFSHGFMSFAAIGVTVACLVIMGTFTLVAVNADAQLKDLENENEFLAFVDESLTRAEAEGLKARIEAVPNVRSVRFITREEATDAFADQYPDEQMFQDLDPEIFRDRYAVHVEDLSQLNETVTAVSAIPGIGGYRADEEVAGGLLTVRNIATVVCLTLIAILFLVSIFIISNTIKLTTFDRRMVGATNGFIRWPFVYEGFMIGLLSAVIAFGLQWLLYAAVAKGVANSDTLKLIHVVDFTTFWKPVAAVFAGAGILIGVGGSLSAIRKFLQA